MHFVSFHQVFIKQRAKLINPGFVIKSLLVLTINDHVAYFILPLTKLFYEI